MKAKPGKIISQIAIWLVVLLFALSCLLPLLNMVAISLSGSDAVAANKVGLWPVDFTITTYNKSSWRFTVLAFFLDFSKESSNWYFNQYVFSQSLWHIRFLRVRNVFVQERFT